jgi:hypothetical protein
MRQAIQISLLLLGVAGLTFGQTNTGTITGVVADPTGASVAGTTVRLTSASTNAAQTATTGDSGAYTFASLPPGFYKVEAEKAGFKTASVEHVEVLTAQVTSVDIHLVVGDSSTTIRIVAEAQVLSPDSAALNHTVASEVLVDTPFPERSALGAIMLVAGVQGDPQYADGIQSENPGITTQPVTPATSIQLSGSRPGQSSMLVDGSDITLIGYPRAGVTFSSDTVQEITVQQNGLPAQYGRTGGGIVNQSTRAGSNLYHGQVNWQHLDPAFEARTFGAPARPQRHTQMYGGSFGGPVWIPKLYNGRNRTFLFVSVEPLRQTDQQWNRVRLLTPGELQGNFNNSLDLLNQTIRNTQGMDAALAAPRAGSIYYQFNLNAQGFPIGTVLNASQYVAVPNNDLSAQLQQNKTAQYVFSKLPTVANPGPYAVFYRPDGLYASDGTNAYGARGVESSDNRFTLRGDHTFSPVDHFSIRYSRVPVGATRYDFMGPNSPLGNIFTDSIDADNGSFGETHTFSGSAVNEFRATYTRGDRYRGPIPAALMQDYASLMGLYPAAAGAGFPLLSGWPGNNIGSGGSTRDGGHSIDVNLGLADDFTLARGAHTLKFGGEVRFLQLNRNDNSGLYGGTYGSNASQTNSGTAGGSSLASFILGLVYSYSATTVPLPYYYRWHYYAGYAQDDWKVRHNVTLNLGVRYNVETPRTEKYDHQGTFVPSFTGTLNGLPATGAFVFSGTDGLPRTLWPINYMGVEPRVGIAWAPSDRMTIRGSYALSHAPLTGVGNVPLPDLGQPAASIGKSLGGVNPNAYVDYITNPVATLPPPVTLNGQPQFTWPAANLIYVNQSSAVPYVQLVSFSMQYRIAGSVVEASYSRSKGTHLMGLPTDMNSPTLGTLDSYIASNANFNSSTIPNVYNTAKKMTLMQSLRPFQQFYDNAITSEYDRNYDSEYNALYVTVRRRLSRGLMVTASYSWSKSMDDASSGQTDTNVIDIWGPDRPQYFGNSKAERSVSSFDVPQRVSAAFSYRMPFDKLARGYAARSHFVSALVNGWVASGFAALQGGAPLYVTLGNTGYFFTSNGGTVLPPDMIVRPNMVLGAPLIKPNWRKDPLEVSPGDGHLNTAAFSVPGAPGLPQLGNAPRTMPYARDPNTMFFDASARKSFRIRERGEFQLRVNAINVLNHPNFLMGGSGTSTGAHAIYTTANTFVQNATFGQLSATTPGRVLRIELRARF